jgi:pimeloyl-ACP methyl ester carboxylesterase
MESKKRLLIGCIALGLSLALDIGACTSDDDKEGTEEDSISNKDAGEPGADASTEDQTSDECPVVVADEDCDTSKRPFVFVHGTFGSGDNIANVAMLFGSNRYCQDRFVAIEYNSLDRENAERGDRIMNQIDQLVDKVLEETGADKVELAGHSQGTGHCTYYLSDPDRAAKVAHYINYSGGREVPSGIPTLALSSDNDASGAGPVYPPENPDVLQVNIGEEDHFAVAASRDAFVETWKFLYGEEPQYTTIQCGQDPVIVEGIAESFGDNVPVGGKLEVYELDYDGEPYERGEPVMVVGGTTDGKIGPLELKRNVPYEFKGFGEDGELIGYVYFAPFKRSNRLARFLVPSSSEVVAPLSTDNIVTSDGHMAIITRYLAGAFRADLNNTLTFNGEQQVLTDDNAGKEASIVGLFMYDDNLNGESELGSLFTAPFIVGTDAFFDASTPAWLEIEFNDPVTSEVGPITIKIPNWPSSEALNLVYF